MKLEKSKWLKDRIHSLRATIILLFSAYTKVFA